MQNSKNIAPALYAIYGHRCGVAVDLYILCVIFQDRSDRRNATTYKNEDPKIYNDFFDGKNAGYERGYELGFFAGYDTGKYALPDKSIGEHIHKAQLETHEVIAGSGVCINEGLEIPYESGTMTVLKMGTPHSVNAGADGLYIFAKFIPALC